MSNLENICTDPNVAEIKDKNHITEVLKDYLVDTSASLMFYTPLMASAEVIAGMDSKEVIASRLSAIGVHALVMRPYGKFRKKWANYFNADGDSSRLKKFAVDASSLFLYQIPVYSTILYSSGASLEEASVALPIGLGIGLATGRPYGYFLDKWRKTYGRETTLEKNK